MIRHVPLQLDHIGWIHSACFCPLAPHEHRDDRFEEPALLDLSMQQELIHECPTISDYIPLWVRDNAYHVFDAILHSLSTTSQYLIPPFYLGTSPAIRSWKVDLLSS